MKTLESVKVNQRNSTSEPILSLHLTCQLVYLGWKSINKAPKQASKFLQNQASEILQNQAPKILQTQTQKTFKNQALKIFYKSSQVVNI